MFGHFYFFPCFCFYFRLFFIEVTQWYNILSAIRHFVDASGFVLDADRQPMVFKLKYMDDDIFLINIMFCMKVMTDINLKGCFPMLFFPRGFLRYFAISLWNRFVKSCNQMCLSIKVVVYVLFYKLCF